MADKISRENAKIIQKLKDANDGKIVSSGVLTWIKVASHTAHRCEKPRESAELTVPPKAGERKT
jgi:hypothetical protein